MPDTLKMAELIGSLSYALDITEGQPEGHCVRCCWIGIHIGRQIGLPDGELWQLYYTLLLKDLGCSSNAARICELYLTDDREFKRDFKLVGSNLSQVLGFVFAHTGRSSNWSKRLSAILNILRNGDELAAELIQTRCDRGAAIARQLRFPEAVAQGIHALDEHWNGSGRPEGLQGEAIPLFARIALLAQVIDVFQFSHGRAAALAEARLRAGQWFDPALVDAFAAVAADDAFWAMLADPAITDAVLHLEPANHVVPLDDDYMDEIAAAFGQVVDSKSPFTAGHSERVGFYTELIASGLGMPAPRRRWLRRAALLHDVGKLGVSNSILDKPGKLELDEWQTVQLHARYTEEILGRIAHFSELARIAGAHHERLDGGGYPRGLQGDAISLETRIITTADIFDAISAERPYHAPNSPQATLDIMRGNVGPAIDPACFAALEAIVHRELPTLPC
ncbi:HD-GYP domain-containing protein [Chitinilyticum litopenaei]|uniref:HD-GYP domain-containing protein n=1 Tax=Chitinilyticum litopenaei TaxID=1121276 RepID=UPI0003F83A97|nr:HD-GYP domain-containing protein [Chitinilyticum litopenaei]